MTAFPENDIAVIRTYLPDGLPDRLRAVAVALAAGIHDGPIEQSPRNASAIIVNDARRILRRFILALLAPFDDHHDKVLTSVYDGLVNAKFEAALSDYKEKIKPAPAPITPPAAATRDLALTARPRTFTVEEVLVGPGDPAFPPPVFGEIEVTLDGYQGPRLTRAHLREISDYADFASDGVEFAFRRNVINAACHRGLGQLDRAITLHANLLQFFPRKLGDVRRRFVALRLGALHVEQGDDRFRRAGSAGEPELLRDAMSSYRSARRATESVFGAGPHDNPLVSRTLQRAEQQLTKIERGTNYLGFAGADIPPQRYTTLFAKAKGDAQAAVGAEDRFLAYLRAAEDMQEAKRQLLDNATDAEIRVEIARRRKENAGIRIQDIDDELDAIEDKIALDVIRPGLTAIAQSADIVTGRPPTFTGLTSLVLDSLGRRADLRRSQRGLEFDRRLALGEDEIARLEVLLAENQVAFVQDAIRAFGNRRLDEDAYHQFAATLDGVRQEYVDDAVRFAYLAERALAFELLEPSMPSFIRFDYARTDGELSGTVLDRDLDRLEAHRVESLEQVQTVRERYFLRRRFPAEFARFQQTGVLDFQLSLLDFEREHPGTAGVTIADVSRVKVIGLTPAEGVSGQLIHFGSFLVRDRDATLRPEVDRLVPTDAQLDAAFERLEKGDASAVEVGGVLQYDLDPAVLVLPPDGEVDQGADSEVRKTFEGYAPNGLWRLVLPEESNDLDLTTIADIELAFTFHTFTPTSAITAKVRRLVADLEAELRDGDRADSIVVLSVREHLPDAADALGGGTAQLPIDAALLPDGHTAPVTTSVVVRAMGADRQGVAGVRLALSAPDGAPLLDEVTRDDGFTADIVGDPFPQLEPDRRTPLLGGWTLTVGGPAGDVDDLLVLLMYEFGPEPDGPG
jgi:hypothetical protein